jgi:outer membrane lipoprotein-sorting protein
VKKTNGKRGSNQKSATRFDTKRVVFGSVPAWGDGMKRIIALLMTVVLGPPLPLLGQTVEEIIAKSIDARGGMRKIKSVQSQRLSGHISVGAAEGTIRIERKRPGKLREEITLEEKTLIRATNGKTGWMINPFSGSSDPEPLSADDFRLITQQADFDRPLVDYKDKGNQVELVDREKLDDKEVYKLKVTLKDGEIRYDYIGVASSLELKWEGRVVRNGNDFPAESFFRDYRSVDGLMYPFLIESDSPGNAGAQKIVFDKVELNPPLDDIRFEQPAPAGNQK